MLAPGGCSVKIMKVLRLQMHTSLDGFVARPNGENDWMTWEMGEKVFAREQELIYRSDTILMGRKMAKEFVDHWQDVLDNKPDSPMHRFAKSMVELPKVVFSKTVDSVPGRNVRVENGDLVEKVNELKNQPGKDLLVYGGAGFVSSLIRNGLIDDFNLFVHPTAIGDGMSIFSGDTPLKLRDSKPYDSGIVVNVYEPVRADSK